MDTSTRRGSGDLQKLTDQIEEGVVRGAYTWREIQQALVAKTRETAQNTDAYVHDHPWKVIGVAAAVGLVLGLLLAQSSEE